MLAGAFAATAYAAAPLVFSTSENVSLSSPATVLTIASGSAADVLQVNATSMVVTMSTSTGGAFTVVSPYFDLSVTSSTGGGTVTSSCTLGVVSTTISQNIGSTFYTITPSGTTCSGNAGLPVINSFSANPSSITAGESSVLSWTVSNASTTTLDNGIGNVTNQTSISVSPSQTTTYTLTATSGSGSSTTAGVTVTVTVPSSSGGSGGGGGGSIGVGSQFGSPYISGVGIIETSTPSSTATVITSTAATSTAALEAELNSLLALLAQLESQARAEGITLPGASGSFALFERNLRIGLSGADVTELQTFLAEDSALYPQGEVTGYYGVLTQKAVALFQTKYAIANETNPAYGAVGPLTRARLNSLIEQGIAP